MPLPFTSRSHGTVAFGFFNIEIDMLLLEDLFFFAESFCEAVVELLAPVGAELGQGTTPAFASNTAAIPGWRMKSPAAAGNVNLAISRVDLSGFIGESYGQFPFPERPEGFKQKPEAQGNRPWAKEAIRRYAKALTIPLRRDEAAGVVWVDRFAFDQQVFLDLVAYVDRGGYPRWEGEVRPHYVTTMMSRLLVR